MNADPVQGEFFTPEGLADGLVRESIQNSLDARVGRDPVTVRFFLSGNDYAVPAVIASKYHDGLWTHLRAIEGGRTNLPSPDSPVPFLAVEDFGTRGLCGSVEQDDDGGAERKSRDHDFFYFWRNIGRSSKQETERGRWGLGKTVFPATSLVNSFFGLTVRLEDRNEYLMGQSVLKVHRVDGERYCPFGFYANIGDDDFQRPITDVAALDMFRKDFRLRRRHESGLSVVVLFPDPEEVRSERMVQSAILHYFYPIIRGELIVEVQGQGRDLRLDAESIDAVAECLDWSESGHQAEELKRLFGLVRRIVALGDDDRTRLPEPVPHRSPDWNQGRFDEEVVQRLKNAFATAPVLAVRVPVTIKPRKGVMEHSYFDVFIERDETLLRPEDHYIRGGITISQIRSLREKNFRGLLVVEDRSLSTLLGDAENPAHTEWQERATKLKEKYDWGPYTVRFLRNAIQRIVAQLLFVPEGRDENLLENLFFIETPADGGKDSTRRRGKKESGKEPEPEPPPPRPSPFTVRQVAGGFRVAGSGPSSTLPQRIRIDVAYEVRRGNPFKKYEKFDFRLQERPIVVRAEHANVHAEENRLLINPEHDGFMVEVIGFDPHRDLTIWTPETAVEASDAPEI